MIVLNLSLFRLRELPNWRSKLWLSKQSKAIKTYNNISRFWIGHYIPNEIFDINNCIIIIVRTYNIRYLSCKFNNHVVWLKQNNMYCKINFIENNCQWKNITSITAGENIIIRKSYYRLILRAKRYILYWFQKISNLSIGKCLLIPCWSYH